MKVPLKWLAEYVELPEQVDEVTRQLTAIGHMQDKPPEEIAGDTVLDLEVRQNRSDCLSIIGVAREVAAVRDTALKVPADVQYQLPPVSEQSHTVIETENGYRFHSLRIEQIKVGPSPEWLRQRLEAYGIKSINNLVDITNYVMVELGEPLHAFDLAKVGPKLVVRQAFAGEEIMVLGGRTIKLDPADIVIADDQRVLAMGGMIGGVESSITDSTTSILLEAATYNQASIRRSSLRHSLRTEASLRHEKFLHPDLTEVALRRAAALIVELCGATVTLHDDAYPKVAQPIELSIELSRLQQLCGVAISQDESQALLQRLGIGVEQEGDARLRVSVPYFRTDLSLVEDIYEEVLRIYGYDRVPDRLPPTAPPVEITSVAYQLEDQLRDILVGYGFDEIITEPLTKEAVSVLEPVVLQNSLNSEKTMLRTTLRYGLEQTAAYHRKFKKKDLALFEVGKVYYRDGDTYGEKKVLAGLVEGAEASYATVKGLLEAVLLRLGYAYDASLVTITGLTPHQWYFELATDALADQTKVKTVEMHTAPPQIVYQDLSAAVPAETKVGELMAAVAKLSPLIYRVQLGEAPRQLDDHTKTVFLKLQYRDDSQQLSSEVVEPVRQAIINEITSRWSGTMR